MNNLQLKVILSAADRLTSPFKNALKSTKGLTEALRTAKKNAAALEFQNVDVSKYRNLSRSIGVASNELKVARARATELAKGIAETNAPTVAMTREFERAKKAVNELQAQQNANIHKQQSMRESMKNAGIDVRHLASEQRRLKGDLIAANRAVDEQRKKLDKLSETQKRLGAARASYQQAKELQSRIAGSGIKLTAGGAAAGAVVVKPIIEFAKAENSATDLKVSMMGAGGIVRKEFGAINELASRLGNKLPGTTSELQNMISVLIQQGMSAKSILGGLGEATAYLAVQMKMPYEQAALFSAKLQDATSTAEKDMMGLMDVIQRSYFLGVDSGNMLQAFGKLSPALSILRKKGLEASKALAPLIVMADQSGMAGEASGNAFRKVFQMSMNATKVGKANSGSLAGTGIKLQFSDGKGEFAGIDNLMSELAKMKKLTTERRLEALKTIYGDDAETLQVLNLLIEKGSAGYADVQAKMNAQANLQQRVNAQLGTLTNLWDAATGTFTNALVKFGESVSPEIKAVTEWIGNLSEKLGEWSQKHQVLSAGIMKTGAAVAVVMAGLGGLSLAVSALLGPLALSKMIFTTLGIKIPMLASPLSALTGSILRFGTAIMVTPVGWIVAGLAAIGVGVVMLIRHWEGVKAFIGGFIDGFLSNMGPLKQYFETIWGVFKGIGSAIGWVVNKFSELISPVQYSSTELNNATNAGKKFGEIVGEAINLILSPLTKLMEGIQWVIDNIDKIGGIGAKVNAQRIAENPALASGYITGNYGKPVIMNNYTPIDAGRTTTNTTVIHQTTPIVINTHPGMDESAIAKKVETHVKKVLRDNKKTARSRLDYEKN